METGRFIEIMNSGEKIAAGSETHRYMTKLSFEAMKVTACLNQGYHEPEEIRKLFSELIGKEVDESFGLFPPFYTDCGKIYIWADRFSSIPAVIFRTKVESISETVR